ncbi:MAG: hypothetical protein COU85_00540 [Candidatus Portnoybacteria bacterium CG10_big_fil_rev_8_21_14_0_10_44_7]|uniref:RNHCP domain-containing protein n=1 Tax=Candidatus Portnoybacteria bacterium CG10_big_fil_rev_8_21_14_0_10_44_7 TaxID=1974816 RepID=A0A2M8KJD0_9BACT|nr:MAG: hypothetical protein COU85_00540 [Candidatus Portnoybacteria bacterium CG10_big_fil_rev_8_21_14_0_10_44_7]
MVKKFQRQIEDFQCAVCGQQVTGNGYTNHCSNCLWSKHVDQNPGDRQSGCGGLMEPVALENRAAVFYLIHRCQKCGCQKANQAQRGDNFEKLVELSQKTG